MSGPVSEEVRQGLFVDFVARRLEVGDSAGVLSRKLSALAFLCRLSGWVDFTKAFLVKQALKGLRRGSGSGDRRRPVSWDILRGLLGALHRVCSSQFEVRLFTLAFSLAFYGAFRLGELVSPSKKVGGGLLVQDIASTEQMLRVKLRKSKTDQLGRGTYISLFCFPECISCPVRAHSAFMEMRGPQEGPLLIHQDGTFLSRFQFIAVFRKSMDLLGLQQGEYGSHSFRIGAATEAARLGLPVQVIKNIGRWESQRFLSYVRPHRVQSVVRISATSLPQ